jgi:hypothetical protein
MPVQDRARKRSEQSERSRRETARASIRFVRRANESIGRRVQQRGYEASIFTRKDAENTQKNADSTGSRDASDARSERSDLKRSEA